MKKIFSNNFLTKTARNIIKVSLGDIISKIFSVGSILILIRGLSIEDYTAYIFISSVGIYLATVIGSGINMAMVRYSLNYSSRFGSKPKALYQLAFFVELIVFLLLSMASFFFTTDISVFLFGQSAFSQGLLLSVFFGMGLLVFNFCRAIFQAEEQFSGLIISSLIMQFIVFLLLIGSFLLRELSVGYVALSYIIVYFIIGVVVLYMRSELFSVREAFLEIQVNKKLIIKFLEGSGWLIGYFFILSIMSRLDIYFLARYAPAKDLAIYGVALQYYGMGILLLGSINSVLLPRFSHIEMQNNDAQKAFSFAWLKFSIWLLVPIVIFDMLGKQIFVFINGARYENAFPIFVVFSFGIWLSMMFSPLVNILLSNGKFRFLFILSVIALIANIIGNMLIVPMVGGIGAAIVVVTYNLIINIPAFIKSLDNGKPVID